ncbi:response regulator transcription factor [Anaerorhabdus sp.]|uniref:response regulator transcription factor n=1 Tax=Anaerorhabdus sp. TaxID=1872524 RepID=UPI002B218840|nr:response regulator transcription factor [Anaerorhabdus sp.]MEA4875055.1 response regulator transcription factor [Anaerorhabdus sp.]
MNILIVEDDKDIVELLRIYLSNEGYQIYYAYNGVDGLEQFKNHEIHLCIFDIMMPKMNGFELAKSVRESSNAPILFLTAKSSIDDRILGLNLGGDDYISKPFNPLEIVARVKSNLRRAYQTNVSTDELELDGLTLKSNSLSCIKDGVEIFLTPTEFKILSLLMKSPNKIFTKVQIYEQINGEYLQNDDNTMMVHMSKLRDKIEDDSRNPKYIKTIRGLGYKFETKKD